jgi:hypothetical protein
MSAAFQTPPITPLATIQPSIALTKAECPDNYRQRLAQKPRAFDVMKDARVARSMYQRKLLRQFMRFLVSRGGSILRRTEFRVAEASVRNSPHSRTPSPYYSLPITHSLLLTPYYSYQEITGSREVIWIQAHQTYPVSTGWSARGSFFPR